MPGEYSSPTLTGESQRPDTWREATLSSIAEVRFSSVDKITHTSEESVRLCNYIDVYDNDYITSHLEFMRASATRPEIAKFRLQVGDVIITKDSETPDDIGIPAIVDYAAPDLVCGYHLGLIRPNHDEVDSTFLAKQLSHHRIARYFGTQANGLTRYGLPIGAVNNTPLWLPEHDEQKAIGLMLRLVDEAIAKTEAVIAKLKQVYSGLRHDLLTRGLDEHGQFRDPIAYPEQFQESSLGRIPREWEIVFLDDLCSQLVDCPHSTPTYVSDGIPCIRTADMLPGQLVLNQAYRVTEETYRERTARLVPQEGDIIYSRAGERLGIASPVGPEPVCLGQRVMHLRPKPETDIDYLVWAMNAPAFYSQVFVRIGATTSPHINVKDIRKFLLLRPPSNEQGLIGQTLRACNRLIRAEEALLAKYQLVKQGLMTDLLTGRVRVPEESPVAP
jgi:type I restriction enzyme S subunit